MPGHACGWMGMADDTPMLAVTPTYTITCPGYVPGPTVAELLAIASDESKPLVERAAAAREAHGDLSYSVKVQLDRIFPDFYWDADDGDHSTLRFGHTKHCDRHDYELTPGRMAELRVLGFTHVGDVSLTVVSPPDHVICMGGADS